tara:strand:+ start:219 stop:359 length:141 start_codon:yes stop_codon:yes gene_type:complete
MAMCMDEGEATGVSMSPIITSKISTFEPNAFKEVRKVADTWAINSL